jgi:hypothetical protein
METHIQRSKMKTGLKFFTSKIKNRENGREAYERAEYGVHDRTAYDVGSVGAGSWVDLSATADGVKASLKLSASRQKLATP